MKSRILTTIVVSLLLLTTGCGQKDRGEAIAVQKIQEGFVTGFPKGTVGVVIKNEKEWQDKRRQLAIDNQPAPAIDFNHQHALVLGSKSKASFELNVVRLTVKDDRATVDMSVSMPGDNCDKTMPKVAPYQIVAVPVTVDELRVHETDVRQACS